MEKKDFKHFDELFLYYKDDLFEKSSQIEQPSKAEIFEIFNNEAVKIYNDFHNLKSDIYPNVSDNFIYYIKENLYIGPFECNLHSPIFYTTPNGSNSYKYTSPEIIKQSWIDFKISKLWYEKLLELGYVVDPNN